MKYYSNEIVFRGHPDKVCDQISGAIGDAFLKKDINSRFGIEVCGGKGKIFITGEYSCKGKVDIKKVTRRVLKNIGYDYKKYKIINNLGKQSSDISLGVDDGGAGDQGMMFGYACNETDRLLPKAMVILQEFSKAYDKYVHLLPTLFLPDGKAQITGEYDENFKLVCIKDFVISYQNPETEREISDPILKQVAIDVASKYNVPIRHFHINPTGKFKIGGFEGDAGLTGRKIVVDAYQSFANVGGGCMNGKDASKVDFSASHKARELAVRLLKEKKLEWCEIQISYAIGEKTPLAIYINTNEGVCNAPKCWYEECAPINMKYTQDCVLEDLAKYGHF